MTRKRKLKICFLIMTWMLSIFSLCILWRTSFSFCDKTSYGGMFLEILIVFLVTYLVKRFVTQRKIAFGLIGIELLGFSYIHEMMLPIIANVIYFVFIFSMGNCISKILKIEKNVWTVFCVGIITIISLECLMSAIGLGSNANFTIAVSVIGVFTLILSLFLEKERKVFNYLKLLDGKDDSFVFAIIVSVVVILIGRCNLCIDYDGIWYGLRSEYLLNQGNGIYDRIFATSTPNVYPKGYELLILPLVVFPSYSFRLAFNIGIGILILLAFYKTIKKIHNEASLLLVALLATIPGVMSMCTTVKQDSITLLLQIIMVYFIIDFVNNKDLKYFWIIFGVYILSLNMKTTALVFSSGILFVAFIYVIKMWKLLKLNTKNLMFPIVSMVVTVLLCARTFILCGYPYTSLLLPIWAVLGFKTRGPYILTQPTASLSLGDILTVNGIFNALKKIITAFILPIKFDGIITSHLLMTWGTSITILIMVLLLLFFIKGKIKGVGAERKAILYVYFIVLLLSLYSVASLVKNDGNYYMLLYTVSLIALSSVVKIENGDRYWKVISIPLIIGNIIIFAMTGWAGGSAFSSIQLINRGYYNHQEKYKEEMYSNGKGDIYSYFENNNNVTHVLGFGDMSIVDRLPCLIESIEEVYCYGGAAILDSYEDFVQYLKSTNTTEIYIDDSYDYSINNVEDYLRNLIEEGYVNDLICKNGDFIFVLCFDNIVDGPAKEVIQRFFNEVLVRIDIVDGAWYPDRALGEFAKIRLKTYEERGIEISIYNTDVLKEQTVYIETDHTSYAMHFKGEEIKSIKLDVPEGESFITIRPKYTFKPANGDVRVLSVIMDIKYIN